MHTCCYTVHAPSVLYKSPLRHLFYSVCLSLCVCVCVCVCVSGSEDQFLLHPRNLTLLEGSSYSMDCVALHTGPHHFYLLNMRPFVRSFYYPSDAGTPVLTIGSVSRQENNGDILVCHAAGNFVEQLTPSQPGHLTVHSEPLTHVCFSHHIVLCK